MAKMNPAAGGGAIVRRAYSAPSAWALYATLLAAMIITFRASAADLALQWATSSHFHHAPFAAPLAAWLAWRRRDCATKVRVWAPALAAIAALAWLAAFGEATDRAGLAHAALIGLAAAGVPLFFGIANAQRFATPLAFLAFMTPFGTSLLPLLQHATAHGAAFLLNAAGLEVVRAGFLIETAAGSFEIARSCAGLNFLLVSAMVGSAFALEAFRSRRDQALFIAFCLTLAIATNITRVAIVIGAVALGVADPSLAADHQSIGWLLYGVLLGFMMLAGRRLAMRAASRSII